MSAVDRPLFLIYGCLFSGIAGIIALALWYRHHRRILFEVDGEHLYIVLMSPLTSRRVIIVPRHCVFSITSNCDAKLIVRVPGRDMLEISLGRPTAAVELVASVLAEALRRPFAARPQEFEQTIPRPGRRTPWIITGMAIFIAACAVMTLGGGWIAVGIYIMIPGAACIGVSLGEQKKELYV